MSSPRGRERGGRNVGNRKRKATGWNREWPRSVSIQAFASILLQRQHPRSSSTPLAASGSLSLSLSFARATATSAGGGGVACARQPPLSTIEPKGCFPRWAPGLHRGVLAASHRVRRTESAALRNAAAAAAAAAAPGAISIGVRSTFDRDSVRCAFATRLADARSLVDAYSTLRWDFLGTSARRRVRRPPALPRVRGQGEL